jgi:hypothetical protein
VLAEHDLRATAGRERAERDLRWQHNQFFDYAIHLHSDVADELEEVTVRLG